MEAVQDQLTGGLKHLRSFKIEQGPGLLRFIAICAGLASFVCAVYEMTGIMSALSHPVQYILYVYICLFAFTTMLFEAKQEWFEKSGSLKMLGDYQEKLIKHCEFLTLMGGRGLFYIFQATLWLTFADTLSEFLEIGAACALGFVGILHLFAHWGIMPTNIVQRMIAKAEQLSGADINQNGVVGE
mmetsp:Transcript_128050/g.332032  ORF Transcript_128050/g.332032 Transcript_128050/m.332032 type:complete len:185 (+) Transcript_128050:99-653(+)